jgi:hypothetical protein
MTTRIRIIKSLVALLGDFWGISRQVFWWFIGGFLAGIIGGYSLMATRMRIATH